MRAPLILILSLYGLALGAGFFAPHGPEARFKDQPWHPPDLTRLHLFDEAGEFQGLFVYPLVRRGGLMEEDRSAPIPVRFFVKGDPWSLLGLEMHTRLIGTERADRPLHLLGTDTLGRDIASRLIYGGRISLTLGLIGAIICLSLGLLIGGVAGYLGGAVDFVLMRGVEVLMAIPGLYLVVTARQAAGIAASDTTVYLLVVVALALVGWAPHARVIRGMVRELKPRGFVRAAEALGASRWHTLRRHLLPHTMSYVVVTAALTVPWFILGEVALSFIGIGLQDAPSWGAMLRDAQSLVHLMDHPWVLAPGGALLVAVVAFNLLGDALRDRLDPDEVRS